MSWSLKGLTTTPMSPGIEITRLPTVFPTGDGKGEIAVQEWTSVGSQVFQSLAAPASLSLLEALSQDFPANPLTSFSETSLRHFMAERPRASRTSSGAGSA